MNNSLYKNCSSFCIIKFKLNSDTKYCIWYLNKNDDETFLKINDEIIIYNSEDSVINFLSKQKIVYDIIFFDLDDILSSVERVILNKANYIDACMRTKILDFINITTDVSKSCNVNIEEEPEFDIIYSKLFFGENLSAINQSNKLYEPQFEYAELKILQKYIKICINIIKRYIFF